MYECESAHYESQRKGGCEEYQFTDFVASPVSRANQSFTCTVGARRFHSQSTSNSQKSIAKGNPLFFCSKRGCLSQEYKKEEDTEQ